MRCMYLLCWRHQSRPGCLDYPSTLYLETGSPHDSSLTFGHLTSKSGHMHNLGGVYWLLSVLKNIITKYVELARGCKLNYFRITRTTSARKPSAGFSYGYLRPESANSLQYLYNVKSFKAKNGRSINLS